MTSIKWNYFCMRYNRYLYRLTVQAVPTTDIVKNSISSADIVTNPIIGTSLCYMCNNLKHGICGFTKYMYKVWWPRGVNCQGGCIQCLLCGHHFFCIGSCRNLKLPLQKSGGQHFILWWKPQLVLMATTCLVSWLPCLFIKIFNMWMAWYGVCVNWTPCNLSHRLEFFYRNLPKNLSTKYIISLHMWNCQYMNASALLERMYKHL